MKEQREKFNITNDMWSMNQPKLKRAHSEMFHKMYGLIYDQNAMYIYRLKEMVQKIK